MNDDEVDVRLHQNQGTSIDVFESEAKVSHDESENDENKNGVGNGVGNGNGNGNCDCDCDCDCGESTYNRDSLRNCYESCPPRRRTLDEFLESGFQASKVLALSSAPPSSSSVRSTSAYHSITRIGSFEDECGSGEFGDVHGSSNNPSNDNTCSTNSNIKSSNIPLRALSRQRRYWCIILSLGVANSSDATEILCISHILGDSFFRSEMLLSDENENGKSDGGGGAGLLAAAVFLGMLLGGLVVGAMGDWTGRRPMLLLGLLCNSLAGIASALAPNVYVLALLRCVAGVGIGATVPPLFALATELAPPSARGVCVSICASFWMVGSIYVALTALWCFGRSEPVAGETTWRVFALLCALPSMLGSVLVYRWVPESPRFLGLEGRSGEALAVANALVEQMNGGDGTSGGSLLPVLPLTIEELEGSFPPPPPPPSSSSFSSSYRPQTDSDRFEIEGESASEPASSSSSAHLHQRRPLEFLRRTVSDWLSSTSKLYAPNLKQTTWPLQLVWFSLSFGSYGLYTWINILFEKVHLENVYFNALLFALSSLPANLLSALSLDKIGRSTSLTISIVLASASLGLFAVSALETRSTGIVVGACLFQCFSTMAWNTMDTMTSELFPTPVRSTGLGVCAASGRIGAMMAQFVNESLVTKPAWLLVVASGTLLMGAVTPCLLPGGGELAGQPLHDDLGSVLDFPGLTSRNSDGSGAAGCGADHPDPKSGSGASSAHRGSGNVVYRLARRKCSWDDEE